MPNSELAAGSKVLRERYTLGDRLRVTVDHALWRGTDSRDNPVLLKLWPFNGDRPHDVQRALWDIELRKLFRVASSPDAEARLVVLRDAAVDNSTGQFVMVLTAPGLTPLSKLLRDRARVDWLRDLRKPGARAEIWRGLRGLALGLSQLHENHMLHRAVSAESIFVEPALGPGSLRLGGFEWTIRVGAPALQIGAPEVLLPPEHASEEPSAYTFESDWFLFGGLAAHVLVNATAPPNSSAAGALKAIDQRVVSDSDITDPERDVLQRLLTSSPNARLARGHDVVSAIDDVLTRLDQPGRPSANAYLGLIVMLGPQRPLTRAILEQDESINALSIEDQRAFIEHDLVSAKIHPRPTGSRTSYVLSGSKLAYHLLEYTGTPDEPRTGQWDLGFCSEPTELSFTTGPEDEIDVGRTPIKVFTLSGVKQNETVVRRNAMSWRAYLPERSTSDIAERLVRLDEFLRVTNQIELLFRDAEIFAYEIVGRTVRGGTEDVIIAERPRARPPVRFAEVSGGMSEFLRRQREESVNAALLYLGPEESLQMSRRVPRSEFWEILEIGNGTISLRRAINPKFDAAPPTGFARSFDMFGQSSLIRRRKDAIDRLRTHTYLLRAILTPDDVYIDTEVDTLPLQVDPERLDDAKSAALVNIWRTRPIFALQGPPGTGKTTLIANLIGQIMADDPVAQVLVSAQAHAAVDVLRAKVSQDIFADRDEALQPLAIRLPRGADDTTRDKDHVGPVTKRLLVTARAGLAEREPLTPIQKQWLTAINAAVDALDRDSTEGQAKDLCELVKRSANITYSTATARNLAELAESTQSFDWSLIEEAGKAHGFDLVLPLQTGHRWLLIGDQNQLPPYRFEDFAAALRRLDDVFAGLYSLPERAGGLVDSDVFHRWNAYSDDEQNRRRKLWLDWLPLFGFLHRTCSEAVPAGDRTPTPVIAEMLWQQHRMHPTIATLISEAYYDRPIQSMTVRDGVPTAAVTHQFEGPEAVVGRAIVWLDVPWMPATDGPTDATHAYTSPAEAEAVADMLGALQLKSGSTDTYDLALLSVYRLQANALSRRLRDQPSPTWATRPKSGRLTAGTVDAFQGDQADVVFVSLVRNNRMSKGQGLGFLREPARMNVLFSRAERLLVLVGSWEFFKFQLSEVAAQRSQPLGHWRIAIDYLERCFADGSAVKINASDLRLPK
jgi:hypothetical protein